MSPKDFLKYFIQSNYGVHKHFDYQPNPRPRISYQDLKKKKDSQIQTKGKEIPLNHNLIQTMKEFENSIKVFQ
jgi:hypothetical protein